MARADARGQAGLDAAGYTRALLLLSLSAQALGDEVAADAALDRLLAVDPAATADAATYPPPLRDRLERRRASRAALPLVVLRIATVAGATIDVDGRALRDGQAQCDVVAGPHLVRVRASGYTAGGQRVDVGTEPTNLTLELTLDAAALLAAPGPADAPLDARLRELARTLDAPLLVVDVHRASAGLSVDVRDPASAHRVHLDLPHGTSARVMAVRIAAALAPSSALGSPPPPPRGSVVWPWLVAAGVVVVGAVVVGIALSARGEPTGFVLVPESP